MVKNPFRREGALLTGTFVQSPNLPTTLTTDRLARTFGARVQLTTGQIVYPTFNADIHKKDFSMSEAKKGRSIELFFVDGDPDGMLTATIPFQWTGHVLVTSRTQLKQALQRSELERPGVYLLIGEDGDKGLPKLYIGETDEIAVRLRQHASKKEWWSKAICISSSGEPLNKAHARYIESRLIADAKRLQKINLDNEQSPPERILSEAALSHMNDFIENIYLVLPALRFDFFTEQKQVSTGSGDRQEERPVDFELKLKRPAIHAKAQLLNGRFMVMEGSLARKQWVGTTSTDSTYARLFRELVNRGILEEKGNQRVYTRDYIFDSTSAAAAVTAGRPTSGPVHWKRPGTTISYGQWEKDNLTKKN